MIAAGVSTSARAAASSIASGKPSRPWQIAATSAAVASVTANPGRTAAARAANRATAAKDRDFAHAVAVRRRQRQGWDGPGDLTGDAERAATGGENSYLRAHAQDPERDLGRAAQDVLARVEHEQAELSRQGLGDARAGVVVGRRGHTDLSGNRRRDTVTIADGPEIDEPHAMRC